MVEFFKSFAAAQPDSTRRSMFQRSLVDALRRPVQGKTIKQIEGEAVARARGNLAGGGRLTRTQKASNSEINKARQDLVKLERNLPIGTPLFEELQRRMNTLNPLTGLPTPDYNSHWARMAWRAMQHKTGGDSLLGVKSYQQGRASFEGTEQEVIWLDEEPPMDIYGECIIRTMTVNGITMLTFTPLGGMSLVVLSFMPQELVPGGDS